MTEVLDLAAVFKRATVNMPGGAVFEMRNPQEFGIVDEYRLEALLIKITDLEKSKVKSEQEAEEASKLLRELASMIVIDCPADIPDWASVAVFQFWMERAAKDAPVKDPPKPRRRTTAASPRGSKRSTAATPKTGSTSRDGR